MGPVGGKRRNWQNRYTEKTIRKTIINVEAQMARGGGGGVCRGTEGMVGTGVRGGLKKKRQKTAV